MKTATIRDLRNQFARVAKWLDNGETVQIIKRGRPFARVVPEPKAGSFFGAGAGTLTLPNDIDDPVSAKWKAMK